jgi:hypothetical protein
MIDRTPQVRPGERPSLRHGAVTRRDPTGRRPRPRLAVSRSHGERSDGSARAAAHCRDVAGCARVRVPSDGRGHRPARTPRRSSSASDPTRLKAQPRAELGHRRNAMTAAKRRRRGHDRRSDRVPQAGRPPPRRADPASASGRKRTLARAPAHSRPSHSRGLHRNLPVVGTVDTGASSVEPTPGGLAPKRQRSLRAGHGVR